MKFQTKLSTKRRGIVVAVVCVLAVGVLAYLQFHSVRITLSLKPLPVPQDRLLQTFLAATERITVKGDTTLRPGTLYINDVKVKVTGETILELSGVLRPESPGQSKPYSLDVQSAEATVKSGTIEMEVGSVLVDFQSVSATTRDGLAATVKLKLLQSLAAAISENAVVAPNGPQATSLRSLVKAVNVNALEFSFKDQGTLPLPSGGRAVLNAGSSSIFQNFVWTSDGSLSATADLDLKIGAGTVVPISDGTLRLTTAELKVTGQYSRSGATETLTLSTPTIPDSATKAPGLSLEGASIDVNSKLFASIGKADAAITKLMWTRSNGKDNFQLIAGLNGALKLPDVPVPGGSLAVAALTLEGTIVTLSLGAPAPTMMAEIGSAKVDSWALKFKKDKSEYALEGRDAHFTKIVVTNFNGGEVVVPAGSVKLTRLAMKGQGVGVSMSFDPKSNVSLTDSELKVPVLSTAGHVPTLGHGTFKGTIPSISVNAGGVPFTLSAVDANVDFDLSVTNRIHGTVSFVGNANSVRDNIIAKLGAPGGFNVAALNVTSISADVGRVAGSLRFDILSDRQGTAKVDVSAANCSVTATGSGCDDGKLNLVATVPKLVAVIDLASRQAAIESLITLDSRSEFCAWTKGQRIALVTARAWAKVQPFKVVAIAKMRIGVDDEHRIICTIDSLRSNDANEYIRVKVPVRHLPDPDDVIIQPFDTPRLKVKFPLGVTFDEPNPIRSAIQKLDGKSFILKA